MNALLSTVAAPLILNEIGDMSPDRTFLGAVDFDLVSGLSVKLNGLPIENAREFLVSIITDELGNKQAIIEITKINRPTTGLREFSKFTGFKVIKARIELEIET